MSLKGDLLAGRAWKLIGPLLQLPWQRRLVCLPRLDGYTGLMGSLSEIEAAVERLTPEQKRELLRYLVSRLDDLNAQVPPPRKFSREQMQAWIRQDEADMRSFSEEK